MVSCLFSRQNAKICKKDVAEAGKLIGTFVFVEARLIFLTFIILTIGFALLHFGSPIGMAFLISLADSLPFLGIGIFLIPMTAFFLYTGIICRDLTYFTLYFYNDYSANGRIVHVGIHISFKTNSCIFHHGLLRIFIGLPGILLTPFLLFAAMKVKQHPLFTS